MSDLESVLDEYDHDELYVKMSHDGFIVARERQFPVEDEWLCRWDPAHDRAPFDAMETLFERVGFDVVEM